MRTLLLTIVVFFLSACTSEEFDKTSTLAERGNARAQANLGFMYDRGEGVTQDYKQAVKWYRKSAQRGNADAQYNLALMYELGTGVTQDSVLAHMWFNLAAASGDKDATKTRDIVAEKLSSSEIEKAQRWAREWTAKQQD